MLLSRQLDLLYNIQKNVVHRQQYVENIIRQAQLNEDVTIVANQDFKSISKTVLGYYEMGKKRYNKLLYKIEKTQEEQKLESEQRLC